MASLPTTRSTPPVTFPSASRVLVGMCIGMIGGVIAFRWPHAAWTQAIDWLEPLGVMWLAALQMLTLPLMVSMLISTIGRAGADRATRLGGWTLLWCVGFLVVAAVTTVLAGQLLLAWLPVADATRHAFQVAAQQATAVMAETSSPTMRDWLVNLVPTNLVRSAAGGDLLPLIVATLLFGAAFRTVSPPRRAALWAKPLPSGAPWHTGLP